MQQHQKPCPQKLIKLRTEFAVLTKAEKCKHHKGTIHYYSGTIHALLCYLVSLYFTCVCVILPIPCINVYYM